ncbi:MAG: hypothetical protein LUG96_14165 [Tannerellaceae bacterium]|nr:hypothetical protein [Tannerellaceae bacterium]
MPGEMGGIWTHPVKLADGYWMKIREEGQQEGVWLMEAEEYITYPYGSGFIYNQNDLQVKRFQFAPDQEKGVIIEYTIQNTSGQVRNLFLDFVVKTDLSPVWFSKENGIPDYPDQVIWDTNHQLFSARDSLQEWYMAWGTDNPVLSYETDSPGPERTKGMEKSGLIRTSLQLGARETQVISYAVSGSLLSKEDAIETYTRLLKEKTKLLHEKQQSLANLLEVSHISLPDKHLENTYNWVRLNTRWLEMDLDGYGHFLGAGAIEYPWLFGCDNSYALQGVLATGDFELAKSTFTMLKNISEKVNGNGRIIHEMSSNGYVYNKGNTQETAHFIIAVWKAFLWTGDITFLQDLYPYVKKEIHWLTVDMDANQNLFPEGYGIMEVHGLNAELIDVAVYTQQALEAASQMAKLFHEDSVSDAYARQATLLKDKINRDFWDEAEGIYCDFFGTKEQAVSVAKGAIRQLRSGTSDAEKETIRFYESLLTRFRQLPDGTQQG